MKKFLALTGIIAMTVVISSSAYAGNLGMGNTTTTTTSMVATLPSDQIELKVLADGNYPESEYRSSGRHRDRYRSGRTNRSGRTSSHRGWGGRW